MRTLGVTVGLLAVLESCGKGAPAIDGTLAGTIDGTALEGADPDKPVRDDRAADTTLALSATAGGVTAKLGIKTSYGSRLECTGHGARRSPEQTVFALEDLACANASATPCRLKVTPPAMMLTLELDGGKVKSAAIPAVAIEYGGEGSCDNGGFLALRLKGGKLVQR